MWLQGKKQSEEKEKGKKKIGNRGLMRINTDYFFATLISAFRF